MSVVVSFLPSVLQFYSSEKSWGVKVAGSQSIHIAEECASPMIKIINNPGRFSTVWLMAKAIESTHLDHIYPLWFQFLCWVAVATASNPVFHEGSWGSIVNTLVISVCTFAFAQLLPIILPKLTFINGFLGALCAGFLIKCALSLQVLDLTCADGVGLSSIVVLLPGGGITFGMLDIISGSVVSGSARFLNALIQAFLQGLGLLCGWYLALWYQVADSDFASATCANSISSFWAFLFNPILWFAWSILLDCKFRKLPLYMGAGLLGTLTTMAFTIPENFFPPSFVGPIVASTAVGSYSAVVARISDQPATGCILVGVFSLLPGGSTVNFTVEDFLGATNYGASFLSTALTIAGGLALANVFHSDFRKLPCCVCCKKKRASDEDIIFDLDKSMKENKFTVEMLERGTFRKFYSKTKAVITK